MAATMKIPGKALVLDAPSASVTFSEDQGGKTSRLNMVAYSGGIIKGHWHWDDLALDLAGIMLPKGKYPILESHDTAAKIGFTGKPIVGADLRIDPDTTVFVSTPQSEEFQRLSAEGFPFEASIRVKPLAIERVAEGAMVDVNGIKLKGPGTVFRKWVFVEASVCTFGADRNTRSAAFAESIDLDVEMLQQPEQQLSLTLEPKEKILDITELKTNHPELVKQIEDAAKAEAKAQFDAEKTRLSNENTAMAAKVDQLTGQVANQEKAILAFEKREAQRTEREIAATAGAIMETALSRSNIPEYLHAKVKKQVPHHGFVNKDTMELDVAAFTKAVKDEIADWEKLGANAGHQQVLGAAFSSRRDPEADLSDDAQEDAQVDAMLAMVNDPAAKRK